MKLPDKFRIPTPVGDYNPDWAIIKVEDGREHLYLIRETKSSRDPYKRRPTENAKITAAMKHFDAIGINYEVSTLNTGRPNLHDRAGSRLLSRPGLLNLGQGLAGALRALGIGEELGPQGTRADLKRHEVGAVDAHDGRARLQNL